MSTESPTFTPHPSSLIPGKHRGAFTGADRLRAVSAVATLAILDALRRKDLYVMAILCGLVIAAGWLLSCVGVWGLQTFLKDVTFMAVNYCSILLCILLAARQVPEEISRRTLYPLLARPIGRGELLLGKFLGTLAMSWVALLMAAGVALLSLVSLRCPLGPVVVQWLILRALSLAPIAALSICLSLFLTPSAAVLVGALLTFGSATLAKASGMVSSDAGSIATTALRALDWVVPRLDLFDLGQKAAYDWPAVPAWVIGSMVLYALIHTALPLIVAVVRFRRMAL
jgi:ABC-type transport system involved in multi-copper enzyme maturation permease subunit